MKAMTGRLMRDRRGSALVAVVIIVLAIVELDPCDEQNLNLLRGLVREGT